MSTLIMSKCWPMHMPPSPKAVLISLADNANDQGHCWPSIPTICERTCFSERTVHSAIRWLESVGLVTADRSNGRHTRYVINPDAYQPPQELHPRSSCTPANAAVEPPQNLHKPPQMPQSPPQQLRSNRKEPISNNSEASASASPKPRMQTFDSWSTSLGDEDAIRADDPVFEWAEKAGIPDDFIELAWLSFADRYSGNRKRYVDWRAVFRNAVRGNWQKVWYLNPQTGYALTTIGEQYRRVRDAEAQAERGAA
ncbi:helix-turn-helix domain-containing protein [Xanthomonas campestris]|uniref:helix-turn-helix domain-containing protein n=1 Tax=Xanthomonas campestris TaxID=339 RepID=UPI000E329A60|nr:helix-turn-helix domain-containing protein [Xanthomonas campestris]RFF46203.1 helix-turn-helix domain-containing protein [Xanthomonas campestris]